MKTVVHFGAGNIGRGFIGALFSQSGYHVTFIDINEPIIDTLNEQGKYDVRLATDVQDSVTIENVSGLNNMTQEKEVIAAIEHATYVTTAIGPNILPHIAPLIAKGLKNRIEKNNDPLYIIACENQISATDLLKGYILEHVPAEIIPQVEETISFFNSAVDRIVPIQHNENILDVLVEPYYEWVVQAPKDIPSVNGMTIVDDLAPFIERKLFTVNTGHVVTAYLGYLAGKQTIDQTLKDEGILSQVRATLEETGAYLIHMYQADPAEHQQYIDKILERFKNPYLEDTVVRVGRSPLRKLGPNDRLVRPAKEALKHGLSYQALAKAIAAGLHFDEASDEDAVKIQNMLQTKGIKQTIQEICELEADSPLIEAIVSYY